MPSASVPPQSSPAKPSVLDTESVSWWSLWGFWIGLSIASTLYAGVALAPKLHTYLLLRGEFVTRQHRLVALEKNVNTLERVTLAMRHDPEYTRQLARVDFDVHDARDERIAVPQHLRLTASLSAPAPQIDPSPSETVPGTHRPAWYLPLVARLATEPTLRRDLLLISASVLLFIFTFCPPSRAAGPGARRQPSGWTGASG